MYTSTSSSATDSTFVTYDDVLVSSSTRGTVMTEDFEAGISAWGSCSGNLALAAPGTAPDQWKRDVIYLGGEAIAEVDVAGVHELHNDHLGSPRVITNGATGAVEGRQVFGPYGEKLAAPRPVGLTDAQWAAQLVYAPLTGYTGHLQQDPSGLTYMRGRFYSTAWHRFINSDQGVDPSTFNQMAYVGGSPFQATDPSGLKKYRCDGVFLIETDDEGHSKILGISSICGAGGGSGNVASLGGVTGGGPSGGGAGMPSGGNSSTAVWLWVQASTISVVGTDISTGNVLVNSEGNQDGYWVWFMPQTEQPSFTPINWGPAQIGGKLEFQNGNAISSRFGVVNTFSMNRNTSIIVGGVLATAGIWMGAFPPTAWPGRYLSTVGVWLGAGNGIYGNGGSLTWVGPVGPILWAR